MEAGRTWGSHVAALPATARGQEKLMESVLAAAPQRSVSAWKSIYPCK